MICKLLGEIDGRVKRIQTMLATTPDTEQVFFYTKLILFDNFTGIYRRMVIINLECSLYYQSFAE